MRVLNLAVRFVLEVCALVALGVAGWQAPGPWPLQLLLALALPLLAAAVWGRWVAPKATRRLADPARLGVEVVVFGTACAGLALTGHPSWALALAAAYAVNVTLVFALHQRAY